MNAPKTEHPTGRQDATVQTARPDLDNLPDLIRRTKARLLRMHFESGVGHIGGNLSALDLLMYLYHRVLGPDDVFVLSKGHSAGALYATLWSLGRLSDAELVQFHGEGTRLSGHLPVRLLPEVRFATGSLGHGLGLSAGVALGKEMGGQAGRVYCLLSDGDWNEGSTWEALIFAGHHRLATLTVIVDANGLQGFGTTKEVADLGSLAEKIRLFGFDVEEVDGHDLTAIAAALTRPCERPCAVVAHTKKGSGVSFMENRIEWHYLPMTEDQYRRALEEIGRP